VDDSGQAGGEALSGPRPPAQVTRRHRRSFYRYPPRPLTPRRARRALPAAALPPVNTAAGTPAGRGRPARRRHQGNRPDHAGRYASGRRSTPRDGVDQGTRARSPCPAVRRVRNPPSGCGGPRRVSASVVTDREATAAGPALGLAGPAAASRSLTADGEGQWSPPRRPGGWVARRADANRDLVVMRRSTPSHQTGSCPSNHRSADDGRARQTGPRPRPARLAPGPSGPTGASRAAEERKKARGSAPGRAVAPGASTDRLPTCRCLCAPRTRRVQRHRRCSSEPGTTAERGTATPAGGTHPHHDCSGSDTGPQQTGDTALALRRAAAPVVSSRTISPAGRGWWSSPTPWPASISASS
jgi:hypothetical protein